MKTRKFKDKELSLLGFGAMRFPTVECDGKHVVDMELTSEMIGKAIECGVNYFDTAYIYHEGKSESILGKILSLYPRDSYYIADKFPGHWLKEDFKPNEVFEEQLARCGVDYFDFYLLHNVDENSVSTYLDPKLGILDYLLKQKEAGRIRHLGFSTHAGLEGLEEFLKTAGDKMEFCQIQYNYLDRTLQRAEEKYELLSRYGIPVWVMEPVRGGRLANLPDAAQGILKKMRPDASIASWCMRWLESKPNVTVILSGMSTMEQVEDNIRTLSTDAPITEEECEALYGIAEGLKKSVPCTGCRYCTEGCPMGLDIPALIELHNELSFESFTDKVTIKFDPADESKKPASCIVCGKCSKVCPQKINIPKTLSALAETLLSKES